MCHCGQASGTVQDGAANRRLWPRVAADETVTGRRGVIRVFLSQSHLSGVSQPQFRRTSLGIPRDSGVPRNFVRGGGSTNSVEDRENGDLGAVAP